MTTRNTTRPTNIHRAIAMAALLAVLGPHTAAAGEMDHSGHAMGEPDGQDAHAHHNHAMPTGSERTLASYSVPNVSMLDQNGESVSVHSLLDTEDPVLINFIYTTCTAICPVMSATFQQVQRELGSDSERVRMLSISIDPEQDRPAELAAYAQRFEAGPQWLFLTGTLEDSIALQKAFDTYRIDKMNHAPVALLRADTTGRQWIRYEGFARASDLAQESREMLIN